jgi:CheY-like chemotaxis protein
MRPGNSSPVILIVEDSEDLREGLRILLESSGFTVLTASDGREALAILREGPTPSLVITDLMMPNMTGWQLRREMIEDSSLAAIPVIIISSAVSNSNRDDLHAVAYLKKPFQYTRLNKLIAQTCGI